jgi:hypothetical protein
MAALLSSGGESGALSDVFGGYHRGSRTPVPSKARALLVFALLGDLDSTAGSGSHTHKQIDTVTNAETADASFRL